MPRFWPLSGWGFAGIDTYGDRQGLARNPAALRNAARREIQPIVAVLRHRLSSNTPPGRRTGRYGQVIGSRHVVLLGTALLAIEEGVGAGALGLEGNGQGEPRNWVAASNRFKFLTVVPLRPLISDRALRGDMTKINLRLLYLETIFQKGISSSSSSTGARGTASSRVWRFERTIRCFSEGQFFRNDRKRFRTSTVMRRFE